MSDESYRRPSWDEYFMEVCNAIAKRATCDRGRSGCVHSPRQPDPRHGLRRRARRPAPLRRGRPSAQEDRARGRKRHPALRPYRPRRAERHLPGRQARRGHRRLDGLLPDDSLPRLRDDDHQLRHRPRRRGAPLPRGVGERGDVPRGGRRARVRPRGSGEVREAVKGPC